ncbi:MAG: hypothetical protein ACI9EF_003768, partial [Pseudohongiellaceae bacterium]
RSSSDGAAWVCREGVCLAPVSSAAELAEQWSFVTKP